MKRILIACCLVLAASSANAQLSWLSEITAGFLVPGSGSSVGAGHPKAWDVAVQSDGTRFIVGQGAYGVSLNSGLGGFATVAGMDNEDILVMKLSPDNATSIKKRFGGMKHDGGFQIEQ